MKGVHQIYLFAATAILALAYFIQRSGSSEGSLFETTNNGTLQWSIHDFGEVLFGRDSLPWKEMQEIYWPFTQNQPERFFWATERKNQVLNDHYTNVVNLFDKEALTNDLARISANAFELLGIEPPSQLYYYISGIDLVNPCLYYTAGVDSTIAFVGLDNFLGGGYPGYANIPAYQRKLLSQSQLPVNYANTLVEGRIYQNVSDPSLLEQMVYHGKNTWLLKQFCKKCPSLKCLDSHPKNIHF